MNCLGKKTLCAVRATNTVLLGWGRFSHGADLQPGRQHVNDPGADRDGHKPKCLTCEKRLTQPGEREALGESNRCFPVLTGSRETTGMG